MNKAFERCFVVSIVYTLRSVPYIRTASPFKQDYFEIFGILDITYR